MKTPIQKPPPHRPAGSKRPRPNSNLRMVSEDAARIRYRAGGSQRGRPPKRLKNRKRPNRAPLFLSLAILAACAALLAVLLTNPVFDVRQVEVRGTQTVAPAEIAGLVPLPSHKNIFLYYLAHHKSIASRVVTAEPAVQSARLGVRIPDTLVVSVSERQPYVALSQSTGIWLLDRQGVPYRHVPVLPPGLPCVRVNVSTPAALQMGTAFPLTPDSPVGASYMLLNLLASQEKFDLSKIREIEVDQSANLCLNMSNGLQIKLGQTDDLAQKLTLVSTALSSDPALADRAAYLDVTYPERPAWKPRVTTQAQSSSVAQAD